MTQDKKEGSAWWAVFALGMLLVPLIVLVGGLFMYATDRLSLSTFGWTVLVTAAVWVSLFGLLKVLSKGEAPSPEFTAKANVVQYGPLQEKMVCPHCQTRGVVHTKRVSKKKGISGGKATAAVVTGGWSVLATGLSRKEALTEAHCVNCEATWHF